MITKINAFKVLVKNTSLIMIKILVINWKKVFEKIDIEPKKIPKVKKELKIDLKNLLVF